MPERRPARGSGAAVKAKMAAEGTKQLDVVLPERRPARGSGATVQAYSLAEKMGGCQIMSSGAAVNALTLSGPKACEQQYDDTNCVNELVPACQCEGQGKKQGAVAKCVLMHSAGSVCCLLP